MKIIDSNWCIEVQRVLQILNYSELYSFHFIIKIGDFQSKKIQLFIPPSSLMFYLIPQIPNFVNRAGILSIADKDYETFLDYLLLRKIVHVTNINLVHAMCKKQF